MGPLAGIVAAATTTIAADPASASAVYAEASRRLAELCSADQLTPAVVDEGLDWLESTTVPIAVGNTATAIGLLAARRTGDPAVGRRAALVHVRSSEALAARLVGQPDDVAAIVADALRVAIEFDIESIDPPLVGWLHHHAARAELAEPGGRFADGLRELRSAATIRRRIDPGSRDWDDELRQAASVAAGWAIRSNAQPAGGPEALPVLRAAIEAFDDVGDHVPADGLREALLSMLLEEHFLDEASLVVERLSRNRDPGGLARLAPERADLAAQQHRPDVALDVLRDVRIDATADPLRWRYVATIRATALRLLDRRDEAAAVADELVTVLSSPAPAGIDELEWARHRAHARTTRAIIRAESGDLDDADAELEQIYSTFDALQPTADMRVDLPTLAAQALWNDGATDHADRWLDRAVAARDETAAFHRDPAAEVGYRAVRSELDVRAARSAARAGDHRGAVLRGEAGKAAVLGDLLGYAGSSGSVVAPEVRDGLVSAIRDTVDAEDAAAAAMTGLGPGDPERARAAGAIRAAQDRRRELRAQLEYRLLQRVVPVRRIPALDERLDAIVAADGAVVSLTIGVDGIGIAGVGPAGTASRFLSHPTHAELGRAVVDPLARARVDLLGADGLHRWEAALAQALSDLHEAFGRDLREMFDLLGGAHRVIIPHRELHALPLGSAMAEDGRTLTDDVGPISVLPALALHDPAAPLRPATHRHASVAIPDGGAPLMGLEGAMVACWRRGTVLAGDGATPVATAGAVGGADTVHLAVHGRYRPGVPGRSGLQLALPGRGEGVFDTERGVVSPRALLGLFDLSAAHLTVLSACESALADPSVTDDRTGIAGHALVAGSAQVVASLWPVDDFATLALMSAFYAALPGRNPCAALHAAADRMRRTSRAEIAASLDPLLPVADELGCGEAFAHARARFCARVDGIGPDAWAAFTTYGAPRKGDQPWPDDA